MARTCELARAEAGLSQAQLSERAGVSRQYISRIESGTANVKLETVAIIAWAVGQDPNQLLEGVFDTRVTSRPPATDT